MDKRCFSATGKAIVTGGYLVLEPEYRALVVALSARMHAVVSVGESENGFTVDVSSPQFKNGNWIYENGKEVNGRINPFVEASVEIVTIYAKQFKQIDEKQKINVIMYSDPEYHSQEGGVKKSSDNGNYEFLFHSNEITKVNKTGLGSSAGLVTSLTAALLSVLIEGFDINHLKWKEIVHNLSQISHCKAQGKIGSGFDVASATFGSIFYQRFNPKLIEDLLQIGIVDSIEFGNSLVKLVNETNWGIVCESFKIPKGFTLMMGDVQGGSETPKMVSKVNEWRKKNPQTSNKVWKNLNENNEKVMNGFKELERISQLDPKRYELILTYTENHKGLDFKSFNEFQEIGVIVKAIDEIRKEFRFITNESGADIEPFEQSLLLNKCWEIPGIIGGVVPGAGGYDAICLIVNKSQVPKIKSNKMAPFNKIRWMELHEESNGLIEEEYNDFIGL